MSYLRYLYLFGNSGVHHILCCVFGFFFVFLLCLVCQRLSVSLSCPLFFLAKVVRLTLYMLGR
jgi:hypothetical protein